MRGLVVSWLASAIVPVLVTWAVMRLLYRHRIRLAESLKTFHVERERKYRRALRLIAYYPEMDIRYRARQLVAKRRGYPGRIMTTEQAIREIAEHTITADDSG